MSGFGFEIFLKATKKIKNGWPDLDFLKGVLIENFALIIKSGRKNKKLTLKVRKGSTKNEE